MQWIIVHFENPKSKFMFCLIGVCCKKSGMFWSPIEHGLTLCMFQKQKKPCVTESTMSCEAVHVLNLIQPLHMLKLVDCVESFECWIQIKLIELNIQTSNSCNMQFMPIADMPCYMHDQSSLGRLSIDIHCMLCSCSSICCAFCLWQVHACHALYAYHVAHQHFKP